MKIYITGINGMLGRACAKVFKQNKIKVCGCDITDNPYSKINICDYGSLKNDIKKNKPDYVLHTAAFIDIGRAQVERQLCFSVNSTGTQNVAHVCKSYHIPLIHISTPSIFNGNKKLPYTENDTASPINYYGLTKLYAEYDIATILTNYLIIRTNIFGVKGFAAWCITNILAETGIFFDNVIVNVIFVEDLARVILRLIGKKTSILNVTTPNIVSKYEFALELAKVFRYNTEKIVRGQSNDPIRGNNLGLDVSQASKIIELPSLQESLINFKNTLYGE